MLNIFRKKQTVQQVIAQIHNDFDSATDRLLQEAKDILADNDTLRKGERLKQLGFTKSKAASEAKEAIELKKKSVIVAEKVAYFQQWYPNNKFITEELVEMICNKYGLVFGEAEYYKGDVPDKNILEMESFVLRVEDYTTYNQGFLNLGMMHRALGGGYFDLQRWPSEPSERKSRPPFKICAPSKDFDMTRLKKNGYKLEVDDPIVLQPVPGGYLIVSKWGLEASDESLINNKMN